MRFHHPIVAAALGAALCACDDTPPPTCGKGVDLTPTLHIDVLDDAEGDATDAGLVPVSLHVTASVPCLRGDALASVTTSAGTLSGADQEGVLALRLSPFTLAADALREGFIGLAIPHQRSARIVVRLGEAAACTRVSVGDGSAPMAPMAEDCEAGLTAP
jgi:hypothetical protein